MCSLEECSRPIPPGSRCDRKYCSIECGRTGTNRQWGIRNRERKAIRMAQWAAEHPLQRTLNERARSARKRSSPTWPLSEAQVEERLSMFGNRCWMCGAAATTVDHVKPLAAGGPHALSNLRPACRPCNSRKGARWGGVAALASLLAS